MIKLYADECAFLRDMVRREIEAYQPNSYSPGDYTRILKRIAFLETLYDKLHQESIELRYEPTIWEHEGVHHPRPLARR